MQPLLVRNLLTLSKIIEEIKNRVRPTDQPLVKMRDETNLSPMSVSHTFEYRHGSYLGFEEGRTHTCS